MSDARIAAPRVLTAATALLSALLIAALPLRAQITLETKHGDTYSTTPLSTAGLQTMEFRWKYAAGSLTTASWQITFTAPSATTSPVVKSVSIGVPAGPAPAYADFTIPASMVPADHPSTFYVRVRSNNGFSPWLPVSVSQRVASGGTRSDLAALRDAAPAPPPPPFYIPSGTPLQTAGVTNDTHIPLWLKLTKIVCLKTSDDGRLLGNVSDEIYVLVTTVAVNRSNMAQSLVSTKVTNVYEGFDIEEARVPNLNVWGPGDGEARPIFDPNDVIILAMMMEQDGDQPRAIAAQNITAQILTKLSKMSPSTSRDEMIRQFHSPIWTTAFTMLGGDFSSDDRVTADPQVLVLTPEDIGLARQGTVVKKPLNFDGTAGDDGYYQLRFQLAKEGVSQVVW